MDFKTTNTGDATEVRMMGRLEFTDHDKLQDLVTLLGQTSRRRFAIDLSAFYIDWKNILVTTSTTVNGTPVGINGNGQRARSWGAEATVTLRPTRGLSVVGNVTYTRLEDFPDIPAYGVMLTCTLSKRRVETITILGSGVSTIRIDEACRTSDRKWSFTDRFWLDPGSALVWRSVQHLDPTGTVVETEILRPPG